MIFTLLIYRLLALRQHSSMNCPILARQPAAEFTLADSQQGDTARLVARTKARLR
jgi:hypothetical protein